MELRSPHLTWRQWSAEGNLFPKGTPINDSTFAQHNMIHAHAALRVGVAMALHGSQFKKKLIGRREQT
jgi:hypothetical protein